MMMMMIMIQPMEVLVSFLIQMQLTKCGFLGRTNFFLSAHCDTKVSDYINYVGRTIANNSGNYTVKGKIEYFWSLFKNIASIAQMSTIGALHYFSHGLGIIADAAQWALEYLGYKKIGKAVGLLGNVAAGALVGGLSGGPVGAVVGGIGGLVRWGIRELPNLIGWLFNW